MRSYTWGRRGATLLATGAAFLAVTGVAAHADVAGELEDGTISPAANAQKASESAAGGGAAVEMWDTSSVEIQLTNTTATSAYRIRARQEICGGAAAQMTVKVDGVAAGGTITVAATTYTDYTVPGSWAAGAHTVRVDFVNPYFQTDCVARELWLDRVTAVSAATGKTYYVDRTAPAGGNGLSTSAAWDSIADVNAAALKPGDTVLFRSGQTWTGANLTITAAGTSSARITVGSYGGSVLPIFDGGGGTTGTAGSHPITVAGAFVTVQDVLVRNGGTSDKTGLAVTGDDVLVQRVTASGNAIGVQAYDGADRLRVTGSTLSNNKTVIAPSGGDDDYGASGVVVLSAAGVEVDHNTISGNVGTSPDFGFDGSAVEVFGAVDLTVHHNTATDNQTFSELGNDAATSHLTRGTWFYDNVISTSASFSAGQVLGVNVQGTEGRFGGASGTKVTNNTFVLRNSGAGALIAGIGADVVFHNNIVQADQAGYTYERKIDEGHNLYWGWSYIEGIKSTANTSSAGGIAPSSATANPLFVSGTDLHLQTGSPAKNFGSSAYGVTTDRDDRQRVVGTGVDAGAYELQVP
ncbi:carbohydrate-binding domain-containing protein [Actinoplanes cyaneus]|uniref:carbohydrate-binding domain-containing protein n=1 Tax=Actinoplanes cyaneus TaxID=52696 RepID=UPI00194148AD|nr:carbohydrate-binding domain-containing protein [Actinoplanes cyaneus]MCW2144128.1 Right handed beta helix region [Actinoplanes cyaneus]